MKINTLGSLQKQAWVYLLRCRDNTLYCGWTFDLNQRLATHQAGKGARYTRARLPVTLVFSELQPNRRAAQSRECEIKRLTRVQKEALFAQLE